MQDLNTKIDSATLTTKIGLEIHVQLKTKSKMFCGCDNTAEGKAPNSVVCPVCLGQPGSLPVANKQAIEWTVKTGLALNCEIPKTAKFDRKHYFYPDLPKGYQISQYDEPFCVGGYVEINSVIPDPIGNLKDPGSQAAVRDDNIVRVNLTRIHLEEDAGKLIHRDGKSLVDLNRAGTPLMEIVTEPDITSPQMAGDFLRKLQKIVRDVVQVSEASMEKGHLRCDANISVSEVASSEGQVARMSPIIEIKNLNSFKFVEKALALVEEKLKAEHGQWPEKNSKETWGYDSVNNKVYLQRRKEEAADYRYFPEPDLPPVDSAAFDLAQFKSDTAETPEEKIDTLIAYGIPEADVKILAGDTKRFRFFGQIIEHLPEENYALMGKATIHNYFPFDLGTVDAEEAKELAQAVKALAENKISKTIFGQVAGSIHSDKLTFEEAAKEFTTGESKEGEIQEIISNIIDNNPKELERFRNGEQQLMGFFMGQVMKETKNSANPQEVSRILRGVLEKQ